MCLKFLRISLDIRHSQLVKNGVLYTIGFLIGRTEFVTSEESRIDNNQFRLMVRSTWLHDSQRHHP